MVLQSTAASSGVNFARSVVCADCDYEHGGVSMNFREYGAARFFANVSLFGGNCWTVHTSVNVACIYSVCSY